MTKKVVKAKPRHQREYPLVERIVSTNFPDGFNAVDQKCFVPLTDFRELQRRYVQLMKRHQREMQRNKNKMTSLGDQLEQILLEY